MTPAPTVLCLSATPRSVAQARRWVVDALRSMGRDDMVDSAELAVSELVTNAVLHGVPPLSVRLGGTSLRPRVEVADGSRRLPVVRRVEDDESHLLTTVGRGLRLVAQCSEAWGTEVHADGKVVWFVPATPAAAPQPARPPRISHDDPVEVAFAAPDPVVIRLDGLSVARQRDFRRHLSELRRELRMLALAHHDDDAVAARLAELFLRFEHGLSAAVGMRIAGHGPLELVDAEVVVDRSVLATAAELLDVLPLADDFSRHQGLLALSPGVAQRAFARWFLGEFVRQGRGYQATPWREPASPLSEPSELSEPPLPPRPRSAP